MHWSKRKGIPSANRWTPGEIVTESTRSIQPIRLRQTTKEHRTTRSNGAGSGYFGLNSILHARATHHSRTLTSVENVPLAASFEQITPCCCRDDRSASLTSSSGSVDPILNPLETPARRRASPWERGLERWPRRRGSTRASSAHPARGSNVIARSSGHRSPAPRRAWQQRAWAGCPSVSCGSADSRPAGAPRGSSPGIPVGTGRYKQQAIKRTNMPAR